MREKIQDGSQVKMHFSLMLEDQTVIDTNFDKEPACFFIGDGNLLPGFGSTYWHANKSRRDFEIEPQEAFGHHNNECSNTELSSFDDNIEVGSVYSFQNGDGELPGVIIEINESKCKSISIIRSQEKLFV